MQNTKPKRTEAEEEKLIDAMIFGEIRCYFCDTLLESEEEGTTEYGIFYACRKCYKKWGNPDQDLLKR